MQEKKQARALYLNKRRSLSQTEKIRCDQQVVAHIQAWPLYRQAKKILLYAPLADEVNIRALITQALDQGKTVGLPRVGDAGREMDFYRISGAHSLEKGHYGILEPKPGCEKLTRANTFALCLAPGVCFDQSGGRLGYGKGYYDRFLRTFSGVSAGITYACCLARALPLDAYDVSVQYVICEHGIRKSK